MTSDGLDKYINNFRILASTAGFTNDMILIEYFMRGLALKLVALILRMETTPTKIEDWYKHAARFDALNQRL